MYSPLQAFFAATLAIIMPLMVYALRGFVRPGSVTDNLGVVLLACMYGAVPGMLGFMVSEILLLRAHL